MRIIPLVLAAALAVPAVGFTADQPRSFEDPNEPVQTPAGGNPTPTIVEVGVAGGLIIAAVVVGAIGGDDDNAVVGTGTGTTGTTGTGGTGTR